jgi:surface polysaccharide O-acyltransferase-like enzyme
MSDRVLSSELSLKIKSISFLSIILVVFLHANNLPNTPNFNSDKFKFLNIFIQEFISNGICRIAVPYFFIISGFLLFFNYQFTFYSVFAKIEKRIKSLLIPYLCWSIIGIIIYIFLQSIPGTQSFFNNKLVIESTLSEFITLLTSNPIPYQLWFIKNLFLFVLCSPLIYLVLKYTNLLVFVLLFFLWYKFNFLYIVSVESIFFFIFGAYLAMFFDKLKNIQQNSRLAILIWLLFVGIKTIFIIYFILPKHIILTLNIISILFGIWSTSSFYGYLTSIKYKFHDSIKMYYGFTFFLFAVHEPFLVIVKKGLLFILPKMPIFSTITYFLSSIIIIAVGLFLAKIISIKTSKYYGIITGGR